MTKQILLLFAGIVGLFFFIYMKLLSDSLSDTPITINQVSTTGLPLTSTFTTADLGSDVANYTNLIQEMKQVNIDTIIIPISLVDKNCQDTNSPYNDLYLLTIPTRSETTLIKEALTANMKIIFALRGSYLSSCLNFTQGNPLDPNTDMGHLIAQSLTAVDNLKSFLAQANIPWADPRIAGLYIPEEIDTYHLSDAFPNNITFFKELSSRLVTYGKPIILSPYQSDQANYSISLQAFKNIIGKTDISILAPQDSLGTGMTTTIAISKDHFRALSDAKAAYPTKNVALWANIELFQKPTNDPIYTAHIPGKPVDFLPAPFARVKEQIEAARPHVSKMTSWMYQHHMMVLPAATNLYATRTIYGNNIQYTPDLAARRAKLRADYLAFYGGISAPSSTPTPTQTTTPTPTPTRSFNPSDYDQSGKVDILDYNLLIAGYGSQYTLFDYNRLVANFNK